MTSFRPRFSFTLPSVHDGSELECRIYLPGWLQNIQSTPAWSVRGAILAHPYAPLGGCYDDPVVSFVGHELYEQGYIVGTFNFRGAGGSEGRTSWTAKPELADYVSFYGFMLVFLHQLKHALSLYLSESSEPTHSATSEEDRRIHLILGGYSYGSLAASHVPDLDVMLELFQPGTASPDTPISTIDRRAAKIAAATMRDIDPGNRDKGSGADGVELSAFTAISYLLVSPLRPPVSMFLTGLSSLSFSAESGSAQTRPVPRPADQLSKHRTLALYGDQDDFTSAQKLERWSDELMRMPQSQFQGMVIEGAGHFWREEGVEGQARRVLREWLRG